jgi:hypothetical protein
MLKILLTFVDKETRSFKIMIQGGPISPKVFWQKISAIYGKKNNIFLLKTEKTRQRSK